MARSRNIKPGFFTNDQLAELPALTRLLFVGLWTIADRDGRIEDRPKKVKAETMPYDDFNCDDALSDLQKAGFIVRYASGGINVIQVVNWDKHQNPHVKEQPSTLPEQDKHQTSTVQAPDKQQPSTEVAGLIPDSGFLIPDSSPLIPDCSTDVEGAGKPRQLRASRKCPETFVVTDELQQWAFEKHPTVDLSAATDKFRDHTFKTAITDWPGTWRNWVRKDAEFNASRPAARGESFRQQDKKAAEQRWAAFTGNTSDRDVIDVTPQTLELEHVDFDQSR